MFLLFSIWELNDHLFEKELFIQFNVGVFRGHWSVCVYASFPFGFEGGMWDLVVLLSDHCLSIYLVLYCIVV